MSIAEPYDATGSLWRMTVMVTGASGVVGHALVRRLVVKDEVRACVRRPESAEPLRALGAKVALDRLEDADALVEVLKGVFTIFHLVGGPNQADAGSLLDANHGSTIRAIAAARLAGVPRLILVSVPGAHPDAADPFQRAKGLAEEALSSSGLQHAIVRASHVYGVGGLWFTAVVQGALASPPLAIGLGEPVAPVLADDLAAVLEAVDDREDPPDGCWGLEGPEALTPSALTAMLAGDLALSAIPATPGDLQTILGIPVSPVAAAHLFRPSRSDAPDAADAFGIMRTPLEAGLHRTLDDAATLAVSDG